jgi:hypothetical protein
VTVEKANEENSPSIGVEIPLGEVTPNNDAGYVINSVTVVNGGSFQEWLDHWPLAGWERGLV